MSEKNKLNLDQFINKLIQFEALSMQDCSEFLRLTLY